MKTFMDAKAQIWGSEAYACTIVYEIASRKYFAECNRIMSYRNLTEKNYITVLNDMFYDYCLENASAL